MTVTARNCLLTTVLLLAALSLASGCSSNKSAAHHGYETIGHDPRRDTDLAKQKNAEGIELVRAGKFEEAEKVLKEALDADVTFGPAHNNLGKVFYHRQQFYNAAWEFQYAAKLMPDLAEPRNNLGLVLEAVGKLDDAVGSYDEALKLRPENPQYLGNDARARFERGDRDTHLRQMLEALVMRDSRPDWSQWAREQLVRLERAPIGTGYGETPATLPSP
jgi:Tfp pilus assembly protein PilF